MTVKVAVIVPIYNEQEVIKSFYARLSGELKLLPDHKFSIIYVVDPGSDSSLSLLQEVARGDDRVIVISMSKRFGHQKSLFAGISYAYKDHDCLIMMDGDLQHPPEVIRDLIHEHINGKFEVVHATRLSSGEPSFLRNFAGHWFYATINKMSETTIIPNAADFRLISARVASELVEGFNETELFLRGIFSWIGFKQTTVGFEAGKRAKGSSKYSFGQSVSLATSAFLSFSTLPLKLGIYLGVTTAGLAVLMLFFTIFDYFFGAQNLPVGWSTLVVVILFFSSIQLFVLGLLGAYIAGIYNQTRNRPRFIIDKVYKK